MNNGIVGYVYTSDYNFVVDKLRSFFRSKDFSVNMIGYYLCRNRIYQHI